MKINSKKGIIIAIAAVALFGFVALLINNYKTKTSFKYNNQKVEKPQQNKQDTVSAAVNKSAQSKKVDFRKSSDILKVSASDFTLGNKNAPVTMIEYASLSCPHCASFTRESFGKIKKNYIDSGKVLFVFRNFPLNHPALEAAMFASCQAKDSSEKYFETVKALFKTQDSWAFDANYSHRIETIAKLDGMTSENYQKCIKDESLKKNILETRMEASKSLQIRSAPSFFINGEVSAGYVDYLTLKKLIEKKLSETK